MHKHYVIEGDLTKFAKIFEDRRRVWDAINEFRTYTSIDLSNQHNSTTLFSGPIHVKAKFYLYHPKDIPQGKRVGGIYHTRRPTMSSLIYFLEQLASGILFGSGLSIASVECTKVYTLERARVEIEIHSLKKA